jgi:hypothetical protein
MAGKSRRKTAVKSGSAAGTQHKARFPGEGRGA